MQSNVIRFKASGKYYTVEVIDVPTGAMPWTAEDQVPWIRRQLEQGMHVCFPDDVNPWGYPQLFVSKVVPK